MEKMVLDDFIRYAKEQFDCEISVKKCDCLIFRLRYYAANYWAGNFLSAQYDACFCLLLLLTMLRRYFRCIRETDCLRHCAQVYFAE